MTTDEIVKSARTLKPQVIELIECLFRNNKHDYYWKELLELSKADDFFEPCILQEEVMTRINKGIFTFRFLYCISITSKICVDVVSVLHVWCICVVSVLHVWCICVVSVLHVFCICVKFVCVCVEPNLT